MPGEYQEALEMDSLLVVKKRVFMKFSGESLGGSFVGWSLSKKLFEVFISIQLVQTYGSWLCLDIIQGSPSLL